MERSVRVQKVDRLLQKALGEIFVRETSGLLGNRIVTVNAVRVTPDLGLANVYLGFLSPEGTRDILPEINQQKGILRKLLGNRLRNKLPKIPTLSFHADHSAAQAVKIQQLIDRVSVVEDG